ncbi:MULTISPECIES: ABC transporter ATP-binding protein [unclassified Inquilinus]|uniref:ABC transporter ATP-binding protein n=1 Tax=unclassified Inquilinus TaxID=2645927 RepID=UPI003F93167E
MTVSSTMLDGVQDAPSARAAAAVGQASNSIRFDGVTVAYRGTVVLDHLTLEVRPGEILALIGPSGSGKTTALRAVAGFVRPASGRIHIGDVEVTHLPPYARGIGMVVQNYALFPHMRVTENVSFGLRAQGASRDLIADRVRECLRIVGMESYAHRYPRELSGGQQQRVAIARALAIQPRVLLLDEPLSALDAQIRRSMVEELARLHRDLPDLTVLYVTHDQSEALTLADSIAVMRDGRLHAHGPTGPLYQTPPNRFAAEFLGRANLLPVVIEDAGYASPLAQVRIGGLVLSATPNRSLDKGAQALLCVRPHALSLSPRPDHDNVLPSTVRELLWQGDQHVVTVEVAGTVLRVVSAPLRQPPAIGSTLDLHFAAADASLLPDEDHP